MKAIYSLGRRIASFDFYAFSLIVKARGYDEIVFDISKWKVSKWDKDTVKERFESIILPGPKLLGMKHSFGKEGDFVIHTDASELVDFIRNGNEFERIKSILPPGTDKYTVTLRKTSRAPSRNSNEEAWRTFASEIGAKVIEEYDKEKIHLYDRLALYAGAAMNFFVTNGPAYFCTLTPYPCMIFACNKDVENINRVGVECGSDSPWFAPNHHNIWESDELDVMRKYFKRWKENGL